jgi:hypothetical protein
MDRNEEERAGRRESVQGVDLRHDPHHRHRRRSHRRVRQREGKRDARALVLHGLVEWRPLRVMHLALFRSPYTLAVLRLTVTTVK